MHLQENAIYDFDLNLRAKVTGNIVQYSLHYAPVKFEANTSYG